MNYKDTVMGNKKLQLLGQQYEDELPTYDLNHYLLQHQAEVSFMAGQEEERNSWLLKTDPQKARDNFTKDIILRSRAQAIKEVGELIKREGINNQDVDRMIEGKLPKEE